MPPFAQLALFSGVIVASALGGAVWPLKDSRPRHHLIQVMAFAAGSMLGAAFFHMLPEAVERGGYTAFLLTPTGFVVLFLLERYVLVHACEEPPDCAEHVHPGSLGLTAFLGMSVHTVFDGVALGSAVAEGVGVMALLAIVAHKVPSSLSLAAIFKAEGRSNRATLGFVTLFAFMVPAGAALYALLAAWWDFGALAPLSLAFSAGTFLYIAVSDLLPHVNRHGRGATLQNILPFMAGLLLMFLLRGLEHSH